MKKTNELTWDIPADRFKSALSFANASGGDAPESMVRLKFGDQQLAVTGTSNNYWQTSVVPVVSDIVQEFLADPRRLKVLSTVNAPSFTLSVKESRCKISWLNGDIKIPILDPEDFPQVPVITVDGGVSVDIGDLKAAFKRVKAAQLKSKSGFEIDCAGFFSDGKELAIVGTDKSRFHYTAINCGIDSIPVDILIPPAIENAILSIPSNGQILVRWNDYIVHAETVDRFEVVGSRVIGEMPKGWQKVLCAPVTFSYKLNRSELEATMSRFSSAHDRESKMSVSKLSSGLIEFNSASGNPVISSRETLPCETNGQCEPVLLSAHQILDAVQACKPCETVNIELAARTKVGSYFCYVTPDSEELKFKAALATFAK